MNLTTPQKVRKLQAALHAKAKRSPDCRFHQLYDKVYREDILAFAYRCCAANGGAAGVDGRRFKDIESYGVERWLGELTHAQQRLRQWLRRKHKVMGRGISRFPTEHLHEVLGLVRLEKRRRIVSWAPA